MLIDSTHRKWSFLTLLLACCAVGFYVYCSVRSPIPLTGGSTVGLWYGILGAGLLLFAGSLSMLRRVPGWWWLGSRQTWLRGHIWFGLLSGVVLLCHSGFRWGGILEGILWVVLSLTLLTGIAGLILQHLLPRLLTQTVPSEIPYGQIPYVCQRLRQHAELLMTEIQTDGALSDNFRQHLIQFFTTQVQPFLDASYRSSSALADPLQNERMFDQFRTDQQLHHLRPKLDTLHSYCEQRRQMGEQERIHHFLHGWLLLHVPLSVMLYVLGTIHAVMSVRY